MIDCLVYTCVTGSRQTLSSYALICHLLPRQLSSCNKFTLLEGHPSHNLDGHCLDWCLVYAKARKGDTIHRRMPTWATILNRWCLLFGLLLRKHRTHDSICVCVYMCVYTYTHIHTYTHTHKHIYVAHRHIHTCVGFMVARAIPYMYYVYVCVCVRVYVCICVYMCVRVCVCILLYIMQETRILVEGHSSVLVLPPSPFKRMPITSPWATGHL